MSRKGDGYYDYKLWFNFKKKGTIHTFSVFGLNTAIWGLTTAIRGNCTTILFNCSFFKQHLKKKSTYKETSQGAAHRKIYQEMLLEIVFRFAPSL